MVAYLRMLSSCNEHYDNYIEVKKEILQGSKLEYARIHVLPWILLKFLQWAQRFTGFYTQLNFKPCFAWNWHVDLEIPHETYLSILILVIYEGLGV